MTWRSIKYLKYLETFKRRYKAGELRDIDYDEIETEAISIVIAEHYPEMDIGVAMKLVDQFHKPQKRRIAAKLALDADKLS